MCRILLGFDLCFVYFIMQNYPVTRDLDEADWLDPLSKYFFVCFEIFTGCPLIFYHLNFLISFMYLYIVLVSIFFSGGGYFNSIWYGRLTSVENCVPHSCMARPAAAATLPVSAGLPWN